MEKRFLASPSLENMNEYKKLVKDITNTILKNNTQFIVHASGQAQKAVDYILNERGMEKEVEIVLDNPLTKAEEITEKKEDLSKTRTKTKREKNQIKVER